MDRLHRGHCRRYGGSFVASVQLSIERISDGYYWNGSSFVSEAETYLTAVGTTSWSYGLGASDLADGESYAVHAKATDDATNVSSVASASFTYDTTVPTATSINRQSPTSPTNDSSVVFRVTFSEIVTGVGPADFALTVTGTLASVAVDAVGPVSGSVYDVTVLTGTGDGTIRLDLVDNDSIADLAGNALGGAGLVNGDRPATRPSRSTGPIRRRRSSSRTPTSTTTPSSTMAAQRWALGTSAAPPKIRKKAA